MDRKNRLELLLIILPNLPTILQYWSMLIKTKGAVALMI